MHPPFDVFQFFYLLVASMFNIGAIEPGLDNLTPHQEILESTSFQYFQNDYLNKLLSEQKTLVLIGAGWSESSLPKMHRLSKRQHQNRAFASYYLLALRYSQMGGNAKVFYLTISPIRKDYRRFLFHIMTGSNNEDSFADFEKKSFKIVELKPPNSSDKENPFGFLELKANKKKLKNLFNEVRDLKRDEHSHFLGFALHSGGPLSQEWAEKMGVEMLANPPSLSNFDLKSTGRICFRDCDIPHPVGTYNPVFSSSKLAEEILKLMELGKKIFMVKINRSALGDGNLRLDFSDRNYTLEQIEEKFNKLASNNYKRRMSEYGVIIEEYIEGDSFSSPSVNAFIEDGGPCLYCLSEQVLGGSNGLKYTGGKGKLTLANERHPLLQYSQKIAEYPAPVEILGNQL